MKMTTDAGDTVTLSDIIREHGKDLRGRIDEAQKKPGSSGLREADLLLDRLLKLSKQAKSVGHELNGDRTPKTKLAELRAEIAKYEGGA